MKKVLKSLLIHISTIPYVFLLVNLAIIGTLLRFIGRDIVALCDNMPEVKEKY